MSSGLYSFKHKDLYYVFYNEYEYKKLGKKIATELKNMSQSEFQIIIDLITKISQQQKNQKNSGSWYEIKFKNITNVLNKILSKPKKLKQSQIQISETDGYSKIGFRVDYVFIINLDEKMLKIKKINTNDILDFPTINKEEVQIFDFDNIPEFW